MPRICITPSITSYHRTQYDTFVHTYSHTHTTTSQIPTLVKEFLSIDHTQVPHFNPDVIDAKGNTLLFYATRYTYIQLLTDEIKQLITLGANVNVSDSSGCTPLINAVVMCQKTMTNSVTTIPKLLLDAGANPNHTTRKGNTALMLSFQSSFVCSPMLVMLLIDSGTDLCVQNKYGYTALQCAIRFTPITFLNCTYFLEMFLKDTSHVHLKNICGETAMTYAIHRSHLHTVIRLLQVGMNPNEQSIRGWTPLMVATHMGSLPIINVLLDAGADPTIRAKDGKTTSDMLNERIEP